MNPELSTRVSIHCSRGVVPSVRYTDIYNDGTALVVTIGDSNIELSMFFNSSDQVEAVMQAMLDARDALKDRELMEMEDNAC